MKPLRLTMQAFGPFAEREIIDFQVLGDNPLFLIHGATGAGKTTLLDGISYALFGKTTGDERQGEQMRCHHASIDLPTEVEFEFAIGAQHYRVQRRPTQQRPKLRGEGLMEDRANANLWRLDDDDPQLLASRKVNEVTQQVEQIIGLKADQFRQVVVLPQGKFRELLTADASERENIFAQLFQTHHYQRIEERLKDQAKDIRDEMRQHQSSLEGLLQDAKVENEAELAALIEQQQPQVEQLGTDKAKHDQALQQARAAHQQAQQRLQQFQDLARYQQQKQQLHSQLPDIEQQQQRLHRARQAQRLLPEVRGFQDQQRQQADTNKELSHWQQQKQQRQQQFDQAQQAYQQAQQLDPRIEEVKTSLRQTEEWLPRIQQLAERQQQQQQAKQALDAQQQTLTQLTEQLEASKHAWQNSQQQLQQRQQQVEQHQATGEQRAVLNQQQQQAQKQAQLQQQLNQLQQQRQQQQQQLKQAAAAYQQALTHSQQLEHHWYHNQAGLLANNLVDGEPCPVCGSAEHPQPATLDQQQSVSHEQVTQARHSTQQHQSEQQAQEQQLIKLDQQITAVEQQLAELEQLPEPQKIAAQLQALADLEQRQQQQKQALAEQQKQVQQHQQQTEQQQIDVANAERLLHQRQLERQRADDHYQQLKESLPEEWQNAEAIKQLQRQQQQQLQQLQQQQQRAQQQHQQASEQLSAAKLQVEQLQAREQKLQQTLKQQEQALQQHCQDAEFAGPEAVLAAQLAADEMDNLERRLQQFSQQQHQCEHAIEQLTEQLKGLTEPNIAQLEQALQQAQATYQAADQQWLAARDQLQQLTNLQQRLNTRKKQAEALHKRYAVTGTLAEVASGNNSQRLSLHRFVLSVLLDDVLRVASQRLEKMTQGRYQLLRDTEVSDARSAGGLTLRVEDTYTGQQRSAKTLSGGESFMAALALALGLSDVVQSYAGGIKLDTLFIDEGFGSLDDEALDAAIDVLADLRASGRTIGIISHVRELKERLQQRIAVVRQRDGSKIVMRT